METENKFKPRRKGRGSKLWLVSVGLNVILLLGLGWLWRELNIIKQDPAIVSKREVEEVVAEVSKLIVLPQGETPYLATVADAATLRGKQPFFANVENGDRVLLYTNAANAADRKAYLYRPATKQLLNVAPVNIGGQVQSFQDVFSIEIRNGTDIEGRADRMGELMTQVFPNAEIVRKINASRNDYEQSFFVSVRASDELTKKIASIFNAPVEDLPEGEEEVEDVDLVLILGGKQSNANEESENVSEEN